MNNEEDRESHVSYAMVSFSRRTGNPGRLFGSPLLTHESYVNLSVRKAERINSFGHDRYYGSMRGDLIEVSLSAAQFAELLTTMNVGMGVPCTLSSYGGKPVEGPPDTEIEVEKVRKKFKNDMANLIKEAKSSFSEIEKLMSEKKNLTQADRKEILEKIGKIFQDVESNTPFMLDQFEEATERVVTHAKAEVDAFVTANVMEAGLEAVKNMSRPAIQGIEHPKLPKHEE